jgi:hypothetical protein
MLSLPSKIAGMWFGMAGLLIRCGVSAQGQSSVMALSRVRSARFVYFQDHSGFDAVGRRALAELKKWRRFELVANKQTTDLIPLLSAGSPRGDSIIFSGGQTGTSEHGEVHEDPDPNYTWQSQTRWACLTVIDAKTHESLRTDSHEWGGLLTGFNSVRAQLVRRLRKPTGN